MASEATKRKESAMIKATNLQGKASWAGSLLIVVVGLIHLYKACRSSPKLSR
jgi:hypothetical protein